MKDCDFLCMVSSFLNGDSYHAYNLVRDMVVRDPDNHRLWNLFNVIISKADDLRHNRCDVTATCCLSAASLGLTTLQSIMKAKLSKQKF